MNSAPGGPKGQKGPLVFAKRENSVRSQIQIQIQIQTQIQIPGQPWK